MHATASARRPIIAAAAALAAAGLFFASAAPAFADGRTIPSGDRMYTLDCAGAEVLNIQGYSVDSFTGAITAIGAGTPAVGDGCAFQAAYNAVTGVSYFVEQRDIDSVFQALFTFDPATGLSVEVGQFFEGVTQIDIFSIAIGPNGDAYAITEGGEFYSLNLANAQVTYIATLSTGSIFGFAADPRTGVFYAVRTDQLYTLDVTTGVLTPLYVLDFGANTNAISMQVDSSGVLWFLNGPQGSAPSLWSAGTTAGTEVLSGPILESDSEVFVGSLLIVPAKLPATGPADLSVALLAGLGVVLLGGALVLVRRKTI